ncbi:MAG TPA: hypothetical protein VFJ01_06485, partial [Oleiagrimonas sp.]|nr:hypothetical protein [Oleiagrimonas sp.]
ALTGGTYVGGAGLYASSAGTGAAGAAGTAAAGVSWIPIIGWIIAGVLKDLELYSSGWRAGSPINSDMLSESVRRGWLDPGPMLTLASDKLLRNIGVSDKWASLLTGSSLITQAWGHQNPHELKHGISATFGAGGAQGQAYLDWKASGGWFTDAEYGTAVQSLSDDTLDSLNEMWRGIKTNMTGAAEDLGTSVDKVLQGFSAGLKTVTYADEDEPSKYLVTYLGKTWEEATSSAAQQRIGADALLTVLQATVGDVATQMAAQWQDDAATLADGVSTMYAVQKDIVAGNHLLALGASANLQEVMKLVEMMRTGSETLAQAYQQLQQANAAYLSFVGQFEPKVLTFGGALSAIAQQMQADIDKANALAKAAGLQGARESDLAKIHEFAATKAAAAIRQLSVAAQDLVAKLYDATGASLAAVNAQLDKLQGKTQSALQLAIGDKSPLSGTEKLDLALKGLRSGLTNAGDVLSLGRKLYANTADYAGLYRKVQEILGMPGASGVGGLDAAITKYTDLYGKQQQLQDQAAAMQRFGSAKTLAQYVSDLSTTKGLSYSEVAKNLGLNMSALAKDLGVTNLVGYLNKLKLQDVGNGLTDAGTIVGAIHQLGRDLVQSITGGPLAPDTAVLARISTGTDEQTALLKSIDQRLASIEGHSADTAGTNKQLVDGDTRRKLDDIARSRRGLVA